jgi:hypothetical protein
MGNLELKWGKAIFDLDRPRLCQVDSGRFVEQRIFLDREGWSLMGEGRRSYDLPRDVLDRVVELVLLQPTQMFDARCSLWGRIVLRFSFLEPTSSRSIVRAGVRHEQDQGEACEESDKKEMSSWGHGKLHAVA